MPYPTDQEIIVDSNQNPILPSASNPADNTNPNTTFVQVLHYQFDGATWDRVRTATTFKTVIATAAGDTIVWTPAAGKKFRLMRWMIMITANAAISGGGNFEVLLRDATTPTGAGGSFFIPATGSTNFSNDDNTGWIDWDNGYLSTAANNVLNVNLSAALTAGEVRVCVAGTEE